MSIQVKMRGGTSLEHETFTGSSREVTVDTTKNTLVVHDGFTPGGHPLAKSNDLELAKESFDRRFDDLQTNIGGSHNHDDKYSQIIHEHEQYVKKLNGAKGMFSKTLNGYDGLVFADNTDTNYIRTTKNGIIPYQSGGYSSVGVSSWRFANGFFNTINTNKVIVEDGIIDFNGTAGIINFLNDDQLRYDDTNNEYQFTSDGDVNKSRIKCGHIELNDKRIYIGSSFPSGARVGDILIQV